MMKPNQENYPTRTPILDQIRCRFTAFESELDKRLKEAETLRDDLYHALRPLKECSPPDHLPSHLSETADKVAKLVNQLNEFCMDQQRKWVQRQRLIKPFSNDFLLVLVGRVKMGKTSLCECLADIIERGLARKVERFRIDEPTYEIPLEEAKGKEIYAPHLHDCLKHSRNKEFSLLWERLKSQGFVITHESLESLRSLNIRRVRIAKEGDYNIQHIERFEIDLLEVPKMQGFRSGKLCVLDAPGLASNNKFAKARARDLWSASDMAVFLTCTDTPLQYTDLELLRAHIPYQDRSIVFLISKCDHYFEDEEGGKVIRGYRFDEEALKKQSVFIKKMLEEQGLAGILAEKEITGVSSKLYQDATRNRQGRMAVENGIIEGHFQQFLERLLEALSQEGLRRKTSAPLIRVIEVAQHVSERITDTIRTIDELRNRTLSKENEEVNKIIQEFKRRTKEKLVTCLDNSIADAKEKVKKDRKASIIMGEKEIRDIIQRCAIEVNSIYGEKVISDLSKIAVSSIGGELMEYWKKIKKIKKEKIGHTRTGSGIGGMGGGMAGLLLFGPLGGIIGSLLGGLCGSLFDDDVYVEVPVITDVREGNNFEQVRRDCLEKIEGIVSNAESVFRNKIDSLLTIMDKFLMDSRTQLNNRLETIREIERRAKTEEV